VRISKEKRKKKEEENKAAKYHILQLCFLLGGHSDWDGQKGGS